MKTLHDKAKVLDMRGLLMVNGGYSGSSGGGSTYSSAQQGSHGGMGGQGSSVTSSYCARSSAYVKSGYSKNYAMLCGWAKALGLI